MIMFDPLWLLYVSPAILLAFIARMMVSSAYAAAQQRPAPLSGAAAARHVLDSAGLQNVDIEVVPGHLSDHYDPREKVLRLSQDVYQSRSLAAVGIAAHEAGHAIQDARQYVPLVVRSAAFPLASVGSNLSIILIIVGALFAMAIPVFSVLVPIGIALFGCVVFFQVVNLPVEFNASNRAKAQLVQLGIVPQQEMVYVNRVLNAAALTYVAATLQALLTLLYLVARFGGSRD